MPVEIQKQIQAELQPGERIRWSGQPVAGAASFNLAWIPFLFAIPWTAFAIFWTLAAAGMLFGHSNAGHEPLVLRLVFPLFGVPFILIGVWMLITPWRAKKKVQSMAEKTAYVITDRRAIIFDFGFATGLMVKDVRLCLEEMKALGLSMEVAEAVGRLWEVVIRDMGAESDFTSAIKPIEKAAGVVVGGSKGGHAAK